MHSTQTTPSCCSLAYQTSLEAPRRGERQPRNNKQACVFVMAKSKISPSLSPPHTTFPCPIPTGMQRELELELDLLQDINVCFLVNILCSLCSTNSLRSVLK